MQNTNSDNASLHTVLMTSHNKNRKNYINKNWLQFVFTVKAAASKSANMKILFTNSKHRSLRLHS